MFKRIILAAGLALPSAAPAIAADPQKFGTEESATKFCKQSNMVWFNLHSKIYFESGSRFYGHTKDGGYTCRTFADKAGFRENKGN